jgi:molybdopterin-synthase adenylyltransferase
MAFEPSIVDSEVLSGSSVLVVGAGALGSPVCAYLVAAGVGRLGVVDPATVELEALGRQFLHYAPDRGQGKADNAAVKLGFLNPAVQVEAYPARLDASNAEALVAGQDVVVDCSNDLETSLAANDACVAAGAQFVSAGADGAGGWVATLRPGQGACLRCLDLPATSAQSDEARRGPMAGVVGSLQALSALELLGAAGEAFAGRMLLVEDRGAWVREVGIARRADCPACAASSSTVKAAG